MTSQTVTPAGVLDRVLSDVLSSSDVWCKGSAAQDSAGQSVSVDSPNAIKFCMVGAIGRAICKEMNVAWADAHHHSRFWDLSETTRGLVADQLPERTPHPSVDLPNFNDEPSTSFEDVRLVLKHAAEVAHANDV